MTREVIARIDNMLKLILALPTDDVDEWKTFHFPRRYLKLRDFIATGLAKRCE